MPVSWMGGLMGVLVGIALLMGGCGKVTQVSNTSIDLNSLDLQGQFPVTTTPNLASTRFLLSDSPFYVSVRGVKANGQTDELSWGKLTISSSLSAIGTTVMKGVAMRRGDIMIDRPSPSWAYLSLNPTQTGIQVDVRRLKRGYAYYVLVAYNRSGRALMTTLVGNTNQVPTLSVQQWSIGTTLRTGIFMTGIQSTMSRDTLPTWDTLEDVFPDRIITALGTGFATPSGAPFNPDVPPLPSGSEPEKALLSIANLVEGGDRAGAIQRLNQLRQEGVLVTGVDVLIRHLQTVSR